MPDQAYNVHHSLTRKERAEAEAVKKAEESYAKSPAAERIQNLELELLQLKDYVKSMRGEEGITNDGPIFRLSRRPTEPVTETLDAVEVELRFCDENDVQHTGIAYFKRGSIVPPL